MKDCVLIPSFGHFLRPFEWALLEALCGLTHLVGTFWCGGWCPNLAQGPQRAVLNLSSVWAVPDVRIHPAAAASDHGQTGKDWWGNWTNVSWKLLLKTERNFCDGQSLHLWRLLGCESQGCRCGGLITKLHYPQRSNLSKRLWCLQRWDDYNGSSAGLIYRDHVFARGDEWFVTFTVPVSPWPPLLCLALTPTVCAGEGQLPPSHLVPAPASTLGATGIIKKNPSVPTD